MRVLACGRCGKHKSSHLFNPHQVKRSEKGLTIYCWSCLSEMHGHQLGTKRWRTSGTAKLKKIEKFTERQQSIQSLAKKAETQRLLEMRKKRLNGDAA